VHGIAKLTGSIRLSKSMPLRNGLVIDTEAGSAEFRRVSYDIDRTQRLMREVDLPVRLVERLRYGR
jgi:hypothetical protein